MVNTKDDFTGMRFGHLTVIEQGDDYIDKKGTKYARWKCICDCGTIKNVFSSLLKSGQVKSCGCMHYTACKKYNDYEVCEDGIVKISLTNCDEFAICDIDDWEYLQQYCWSRGGTGYAEARVDGITTPLHHLILQNCPDGLVRDHINRNKLDNRRCNLRFVTRSENNRNKLVYNKNGYRGVIKTKNINNPYYVTYLNEDNKKVFSKSFKTLEEAAEESKRIYGELSECRKR